MTQGLVQYSEGGIGYLRDQKSKELESIVLGAEDTSIREEWHKKEVNKINAFEEQEACQKNIPVEWEGSTKSESEGLMHPRDEKFSGRLFG